MRTTVLAYVLAAAALLMVLGGIWSLVAFILEKNVRFPRYPTPLPLHAALLAVAPRRQCTCKTIVRSCSVGQRQLIILSLPLLSAALARALPKSGPTGNFVVGFFNAHSS
jgi:hypothetical protein